MQITHITAAIRYALRSTMLYRVAKAEGLSVLDEDHIDECARFLVPQTSTSFSYCVQVHAACSKFGQKHQPPAITWATFDFSALRLPSGSILTIRSLKEFIQEQYKLAEDAIGDLFLGLEMPAHYARDIKDVTPRHRSHRHTHADHFITLITTSPWLPHHTGACYNCSTCERLLR
ncbi:hypothetical protein V1523DRAFT_127243 [Lipomyces doorenjongii]